MTCFGGLGSGRHGGPRGGTGSSSPMARVSGFSSASDSDEEIRRPERFAATGPTQEELATGGCQLWSFSTLGGCAALKAVPGVQGCNQPWSLPHPLTPTVPLPPCVQPSGCSVRCSRARRAPSRRCTATSGTARATSSTCCSTWRSCLTTGVQLHSRFLVAAVGQQCSELAALALHPPYPPQRLLTFLSFCRSLSAGCGPRRMKMRWRI